jgi:hypothetical protein
MREYSFLSSAAGHDHRECRNRGVGLSDAPAQDPTLRLSERRLAAGDDHPGVGCRRADSRLFLAAGDTTYQVTGQWEDAIGTLHGEGFPGCLVGTKADPVSMEHRRIELDAIHINDGGKQRTNIATFVRCTR